MHQWHIHETFELASVATADYLASTINQCLELKNSCHVILPGGKTPAKAFQILAKKPLPWQKIFWYPGDERCRPVGHEDRNDQMLQNNLWSLLPESSVTDNNVFRIPAELGAQQAAKVYTNLVKDLVFDIALLGMGEDGHTASLFPNNPALNNQQDIVPVFNSPKPPSDRVSFSLALLKMVKTRIVLACGSGKKSVIKKVKSQVPLPINVIGNIQWFVDKAAVE